MSKYYTKTIIVSPYSGDVETNKRYLNECIRDSIINHNEAPIASHKLYTDSLDDSNEVERELGMELGWQLMGVADKVVIYGDLGVSDGMADDISRACMLNLPVEVRNIDFDSNPELNNDEAYDVDPIQYACLTRPDQGYYYAEIKDDKFSVGFSNIVEAYRFLDADQFNVADSDYKVIGFCSVTKHDVTTSDSGLTVTFYLD